MISSILWLCHPDTHDPSPYLSLGPLFARACLSACRHLHVTTLQQPEVYPDPDRPPPLFPRRGWHHHPQFKCFYPYILLMTRLCPSHQFKFFNFINYCLLTLQFPVPLVQPTSPLTSWPVSGSAWSLHCRATACNRLI